MRKVPNTKGLIKEKILKLSVKAWMQIGNNRGGVLLENKVIMVLAIVVIFGMFGLYKLFLQDYFQNITNDISNNGGVNDNFGKNINW
ncbi:MAG TPA: hypothetical protein GXX18_06275 [Bacillales bacterium]|nr:hypothetical protein [Bacillales bacterium]